MTEKTTAPMAQTTEAPTTISPEQILHGSSTLPGILKIGGEEVQLGTVVSAAHAASGLSVDDWNALSAEDRDQHLQAQIMAMEADKPTLVANDAPINDQKTPEAPKEEVIVIDVSQLSKAQSLAELLPQEGGGFMYVWDSATLPDVGIVASVYSDGSIQQFKSHDRHTMRIVATTAGLAAQAVEV